MIFSVKGIIHDKVLNVVRRDTIDSGIWINIKDFRRDIVIEQLTRTILNEARKISTI